jgi:hypothetical protein
MDDDNDLSNAIQATTAMGSVNYDTTNTHNVSTIRHVSHDHHLHNDTYVSNIEPTDGHITTSAFVSNECRDERRCNNERYPIQFLPFVHYAPQQQKADKSDHSVGQADYYRHHRLQHQDQAYVDEDEDTSNKVAKTQFVWMRQADTSRQMQTLHKLHQLERNLGQEEEEESPSPTSRPYAKMPPRVDTIASWTTTEQLKIDRDNTEETTAALRCKSNSYDGLVNPDRSVDRSIFPEDNTAKSQPQYHPHPLLYLERLNGQPQPSIQECFSGRIFHSVDDPENAEMSSNNL